MTGVQIDEGQNLARRMPLSGRGLVFGDAEIFFWQVARGVFSGRVIRMYLSEVLRQATILITGSTLIVLALILMFFD